MWLGFTALAIIVCIGLRRVNSLVQFVLCLYRMWVGGFCCSVTGALVYCSYTNNRITEIGPSIAKE